MIAKVLLTIAIIANAATLLLMQRDQRRVRECLAVLARRGFTPAQEARVREIARAEPARSAWISGKDDRVPFNLFERGWPLTPSEQGPEADG